MPLNRGNAGRNSIDVRMSRTRPHSHRSITGPNRIGACDSRTGEGTRHHVAGSRKWLATTIRVGAVLALLLVAVFIVMDTIGQTLAISEPEQAAALAPW